MEQKRRTISNRRKSRDAKKVWTIIGIILGLALIFYVSFRLSYGLFSSGSDKDEITQSTQDDIKSMSREELEKKYMELEKKLEEKDKEIDVLTERLENEEKNKPEDIADTESDKNNSDDTQKQDASEKKSTSNEQPKQSQQPEPEAQNHHSAPEATTPSQTPAPAPAAPFQPSSELMSPEDLAATEQAARQ